MSVRSLLVFMPRSSHLPPTTTSAPTYASPARAPGREWRADGALLIRSGHRAVQLIHTRVRLLFGVEERGAQAAVAGRYVSEVAISRADDVPPALDVMPGLIPGVRVAG